MTDVLSELLGRETVPVGTDNPFAVSVPGTEMLKDMSF